MELVQEKDRFGHLMEAIKSGWEIEQPVLLGAMWHTASGRSGVYHFVLRNKVEDKTTLLSLPPSPQLLVFLAEHNINVSAL